MSSGNPAAPKYAIEAQASNLLAFLKETFFKMPRSVQVLGWIVLLFLFVFLVLYPILGITYFHGKVVTLKRNQQGQAVMATENALRVHKGITTYTNEEGEFTVPVRVPNVPFLGVEFDVGDGDRKEIVSIPGPTPFVSMFDPNTRKIYYVPSSNVRNGFGVTKRFFLDAQEARNAFLGQHENARRGEDQGGRGGVALFLEELWHGGTAHAAVQHYRKPTYTLRLLELSITGSASRAAEIYLDITVNGKPARVGGIPHADSGKADRVTIFDGMPLRPRSWDIPLDSTSAQVDISVFSGGVLRDEKLGSLSVRPDEKSVGKVFRLADKRLAVSFEFLPPIAVRYVSSGQKGQRFLATLWLDMRPEFLRHVASVRYVYPDQTVTGFPDIEKSDYFACTISRWQPERVLVDVAFESGSQLRLAAYVEPDRANAEVPLDYYFLARLAKMRSMNGVALEYADKALAGYPGFAPAVALKASLLADAGKHETALALLEQLLARDDSDAALLNQYAWIVADKLPRPNHDQLIRARQRAQQAVRLSPAPNYYDTLGWVNYKLQAYPQALRALIDARDIQTRLDPSGTTLMEIQLHLGLVHLKMGQSTEAKHAFQEILKYGREYGFTTARTEMIHREATLELARLAR